MHVKNILKEMAIIHARLVSQYIFENQTVFSARFDKQDEEDHILDAKKAID